MRSPLPPDADAGVLEQAFYEALRHGDLEQLMACWAEDDEVACVHPGGARLLGLRSIRESFHELLSQGGLHIEVRQLHRIHAGGCSIHSLVERVEVITREGWQHGYLLATNVYALTPRGWRMLVHHASPGDAEAWLEGGSSGQMLH
jgi:ketosteroid isomerase-like protein